MPTVSLISNTIPIFFFPCFSLHPNGNTLATCGTDGAVRLFDIRKFKDSRNSSKRPTALGTQTAGLSVSSAFFSPSGKSLLTTSFANRLDLTEDAHLAKGGKAIKPTHGIRHNNQTGRFYSGRLNQTIDSPGSRIRLWRIEIDTDYTFSHENFIFLCHCDNFPVFTARSLVDHLSGNVASRTRHFLLRQHEQTPVHGNF